MTAFRSIKEDDVKEHTQRRSYACLLRGRFPALIFGYSAIIIGSAALFLKLALQLQQQGTFWFDTPLLAFLAENRTAVLDYFFRWITWAGSALLLLPVSIVLFGCLIRSRHYPEALLLGIGFGGASLINPWLKAVFLRDRPDLFPFPLLYDYGGFAFPSGHTVQITAFALVVFLIVHRLQPHRQRLAAILLSILVLCVAISRLYLQVHYPSDVLGGFLFAVLWVFSIDAIIRVIIRNLEKTGG